MNARDFVAPQEAVTGIAGNSLLVEHIEDLLDEDKIGRCVIGVPEFLQKSGAIPLRAAENEISKIGIEDFVDERAVIRRLDGAGAHDEVDRSEEHTSELQSPCNLVCRLLLEKKNY